MLAITQDDKGFVLTPKIRIGSAQKRIGKATRLPSEERLWIEVETFAQDRLARLGLEKTKP